MANQLYTYQSIFYDFQNQIEIVNGLSTPTTAQNALKSSLPAAGVPTRVLPVISYNQATTLTDDIPENEHVRVQISFKNPWADPITVLDTGINTVTDLTGNSINLSSFPSALPVSPDKWGFHYRVTISSDPTTESRFVRTERFVAYTVRNKVSRRIELLQSPATDLNTYQILPGLQLTLKEKGTDTVVGHCVSTGSGVAEVMMPPGSYDIEIYGLGATHQDWLVGDKSISLGTSSTLTPWGTRTNDTVQKAEFANILSVFSSLSWPGYIIAEDFTDPRKAYQVTQSNPVNWNFGRIYRGLSYVEFLGFALDPSPL